MNDVWGIISLVLNLVLGSGGLWLWRETRRLKKAEAVREETNNAILAGNEWKEIAEQRGKEATRLNAIIDERWIDKAKDRDTIFELMAEITNLKMKLQAALFKQCNKRGCAERDPPTGF